MSSGRTLSVHDIRRELELHRSELDRLGVAELAVFGSVARDEANPDSDIDVLVDFRNPATLSGYVELKSLLESLLGRTVDLVTRKSLRAHVRSHVEKDAVRVA